MEQTSTANMQGQESNMDRESTIQKMAKLIQLNVAILFGAKAQEDRFAYNNAESVATKLYDEYIVPSGDFSTKNIIHIMTDVNLQETECNLEIAKLEDEYQKGIDAAKRLCEVKKLKIDTETELYKHCPEDAIRVHTENCDDEYKHIINKLEVCRSTKKCILNGKNEYAVELCDVDLFVRPRDYTKFWDSLMFLNLSSNVVKFIDDIVNMNSEERSNKTESEHYDCLATLDDYISVHEILSGSVHVDCLDVQ